MEAVLAKHSCGHSVVLDKFILQEVGWENIVLRASTFSCLNMEIARIDYVCIVLILIPLAIKMLCSLSLQQGKDLLGKIGHQF